MSPSAQQDYHERRKERWEESGCPAIYVVSRKKNGEREGGKVARYENSLEVRGGGTGFTFSIALAKWTRKQKIKETGEISSRLGKVVRVVGKKNERKRGIRATGGVGRISESELQNKGIWKKKRVMRS